MPSQGRQLLVLLGLSAAVFFANLGAAQLWDEDEPIFAGTAREMMERGDWVVPVFNGAMLPDKPVGMYWLMMAGFAVFGPTEFAARCGSALFGLASVLVTWQLGRRLFSAEVGFWGGLALATSLSFDVVARAATPDAMLVFFSTLALYCFVAGTTPRQPSGSARAYLATAPLSVEPSWSAFAAMYAAMGLAVLSKGPVGLVLPTAAIGLYRSIARRPGVSSAAQSRTDQATAGARTWWAWVRSAIGNAAAVVSPAHLLRTMWSMRPLTALAVVAAVAGPWYVWVGLRTNGQWLAGFIGVHNVGRFFHAMEHHHGPFFYYVVAVVIGFFPWSLFLTPGLRLCGRRIRRGHRWRPGYVLLLSWIAVYVVFFSLARTKLPNYVLPVYPALALVIGGWIVAWQRRPSLVARRDLRAAWLLLALVGLGVAVGVPIAAIKFLQGEVLLGLIGLPLIVGAVFAWRFSERGQPRHAALTLAVAAASFSIALFGWGAVRIDRQQSSAKFAEFIRQHTAIGAARIRTFGYYRPSLVFYSRQPVRQFVAPEQVAEFFRDQPDDAFVFTSDERYRQLTAVLPPDVVVLARRPWFLRSSEILLLGRATPPLEVVSREGGGRR
ncbi:MAG TPA: glycosyltransferase family 39 protein [Pirellulales bacterium]|nr:glycosyltransferase family 39 protein [Pirellulales bacterium]